MNVTIISPHIDDAAFGLSLTISKLISKGAQINLVNCFTVTKWTCVFVSRDVEEVSKLRKKEDEAFNKLFNNELVITNLDLLDAPLRNGYIWQSQPFQPNEWELIAVIKNYLQAHAGNYILCPLSIGFHIDHSIVREAVINLFHHSKVLFYEDLPYAQRISELELSKHVDALANTLGVQLVPFVIPLSTAIIDKTAAINCYPSQLDKNITNEIITHLHTINGERLWGEEDDQLITNFISDKNAAV